MKNVLVLGAGMVAKPLVRYLLDLSDVHVKIASRTLSKAENLIGKHPMGVAQQLNVENISLLDKLVSESDLVISLLPYVHHSTVANLCLKHRKHMITTSYVSKEMQAMDGNARKAGIIILNEIGLDPGIDHMSAMKIIHSVRNSGGRIVSFYSYCGGLPAPEANTNPLGYKFSWSPRGVVMAAKNDARYMKDGKEIVISRENLFENYWIVGVEGLGDFEAYPNRDSIPYIDKYGINTTKTMYRGTLRYPGWCDTWKKLVEMGFLDEEIRSDLKGFSFKDFLRALMKIPEKADIREKLAEHLEIDENSDVMKRFEWLGLLSDDPLPLGKGSPLDILAEKLFEKLRYEEGERDMIVLRHEFTAEYPDDKHGEMITSTLIDFGIPGGDTAMSRTVGLPAAVGAKLILQGRIALTGVQIPVVPEIYDPVLSELEEKGISFSEKKRGIRNI